MNVPQRSAWPGWAAICAARVAARKARAADAGKVILDFVAVNEPRLWGGEMVTDMDTDAINAIQNRLVEDLELELRHEVAHQFRLGIEAGYLKHVWHIPLPELELRILPPSPLVRPNEFAGRRALDSLMNRVLDRLGELADTRSAKSGLLQVSALLGGGILRQSEAEQLAHLACRNVVRTNGLMFVRFGNDESGRMWFPTALSELILWQSARREQMPLLGGSESGNVRSRLKSLVNGIASDGRKQTDETDGEIPQEIIERIYENLSGVIKANAAKFQCGALLAHASGLNRTHPIRSTTWYRMIFDRPLRRDVTQNWRQMREPSETPDSGSASPPLSFGTHMGHGEALIRQVQSSLYGLIKPDGRGGIEELRDFLDQQCNATTNASKITRGLLCWLKELLEAPADRRLEMSAIYREFNRIWRAVLAVETEGCPEPEDIGGWGVFLASAFFLLANQKTAFKAVATLRLFHQSLVRQKLAPKLDYGEIEGFDTTGEAFDPNIVTPREYRETLVRLGADPHEDQRRVRLRRLATILGFRCGLRRDEVRYLEIRSIEPSDRPLLIVEDTVRRQLKSAAGNRKIPLYVLLEPDELSELTAYVKERRSMAQGQTQRLLFVLDHEADEPLTDWILFDPIQKALRVSSGDKSLVFHHLRHAFVNWLLIRLLMSRSDRFRDSRFEVFNDEMFAASACERLRSGIYRERPGGATDPGARDIFLVALLVGHSSPAVTLKSYFHLSDWLVSQLSQDGEIRLDPKVAARFLGVSPGTIYGLCKADHETGRTRTRGVSIAQLNAYLAKDGVFSDLLADDVTLPASGGSAIVNSARFDFEIQCLESARMAISLPHPDLPVALEQLVKVAPVLGELIDAAADSLGVPPATVRKWVERIEALERTGRTVREFNMIVSPHKKADRDDFQALLHAISQLESEVRKHVVGRIESWVNAVDKTTGSYRFAWDDAHAAEFMDLLDKLLVSPGRLLIRIQLGRSSERLREIALAKLKQIFRTEEASIRTKSDGIKIAEIQGMDTEIFILRADAARANTVRVGNLAGGYRSALSACVVFRELL